MGLVSEFREFITKGSVFDLAVGVVIGAAFQKIVDSLVSDIIMPIIGIITGGINFSTLSLKVEIRKLHSADHHLPAGGFCVVCLYPNL
jgi:large conductance mechanosensitive channel